MELEIFTPSNITFIIGVIGTIFGIFLYFKTPQDKLEKNQAINDEKDKNKATILQQKEAESKATLLAEQVKWDKEGNEKKFAEMGVRIDQAFAIAQNHINTIETEVKNQTVVINTMSNNLTKLETIINERIPKT